MTIEIFKAILHTLLLLIQYRILAGQQGLHGRMLQSGNSCNLCLLSDSHWVGQVGPRPRALLAETGVLRKEPDRETRLTGPSDD